MSDNKVDPKVVAAYKAEMEAQKKMASDRLAKNAAYNKANKGKK